MTQSRHFKSCLLATSLLLLYAGSFCDGHAQSRRADTGVKLRMSSELGAAQSARGASPSTRRGETDNQSPGDTLAVGPKLRGLSLRLTSGLRFDDNVFSANRDKKRDVVAVLKPAIYLDSRFGRHDVQLGYESEVERYQGIESQNRLNHKFLASGDLDLGRKLKSRIESALQYGTDSSGDLGSRPNSSGEPDRWREHSLGGRITLGRRIAKAQVGLGFDTSGMRYLNNNQSSRDFDQRTLLLNGRYNLGSKWALVSDLSGSWTDYLDPLSTLDSRDYVALFGVEWEATAKTSGSLKVGLRHRDFHDLSRPSVGGFTWDARVRWAPKTYSQFTVYTSRSTSDGSFSSSGASSVSTTDTSGLIWRHGLSERTTFEASIERSVSDFGSGTEDELMSYGAGIRYRLNRWLDLFGDWQYRSRGSPTPGGDYEAGSVFIGFDAHFDRALGR